MKLFCTAFLLSTLSVGTFALKGGKHSSKSDLPSASQAGGLRRRVLKPKKGDVKAIGFLVELNRAETEEVLDEGVFTVTAECEVAGGTNLDVGFSVFVANDSNESFFCTVDGDNEPDGDIIPDTYEIPPGGFNFPLFHEITNSGNDIDDGGFVCTNGQYLGFDSESVIGSAQAGYKELTGFDCILGGVFKFVEV